MTSRQLISKITGFPTANTHQAGASIVEFVVVAPTLIFMILGMIQAGMVFHAKSNLNYAAFEAARAGSVGHATQAGIKEAFTRAMVGYYGGGRNLTELAQATERAQADITPASFQVTTLSPTKESFNDYASPSLSVKYGTKARVIPNNNLSAIHCPYDKPSCNHNPNTNASGQTLSDANILRIKITYGIPAAKQMPLVGRFYVLTLQGLAKTGLKTTDAFSAALLEQGRIPMVVHTTMRMQSDPFEDSNISNPGAGNNGVPTDPSPPIDPGTGNSGTGNGNGGGDTGDGGTGDDDTPDDTIEEDSECADDGDGVCSICVEDGVLEDGMVE